MAASGSGGTTSLKEYLKRYESNLDGGGNANKKRKKVKKKSRDVTKANGVLVVDEDPVWQNRMNLQDDQDNDSQDEEDKPIVNEDIEVKRLKRLEQIRAKRAYNSIADDGSGWVTLSPKHKHSQADIDISPPRKPKVTNDTPSPEREDFKLEAELRNDTDLSPPRHRRVRHRTSSLQEDNDASPSHVQSSPNQISDLSPPRKRSREFRKHDLGDISPPRKSSREFRKHDSDDMSPPRKSSTEFRTHDSVDISPPRKSSRDFRKHDSDDISPPRKSGKEFRRHDLGGISPLRKSYSRGHSKQEIDDDRSTTGKRSANGGGSYASMDEDMSPPRNSRQESSKTDSVAKRPKAGLISGLDMRDEIMRTKMEDISRFEQMDPSISGKGAEAVYRDKKGNRISKQEYIKQNQKVEEKPKEKKIEWGKGLAQKREAEAELLELEREKEKPFARTRDDPELDAMLKERVRWGDPMAHLVKRKQSETILPDLGDAAKMKESGFIVPQDVPAHSWIKRGTDAAPNRYGIRPGRHWDGVDRSNGYEKQLFKRMNEKRATESEAYLWSVSDM